MIFLPAKKLLFDRYEIERQIGHGGFGITYKALDKDEGEYVCIKELFIAGECTRSDDMSVLSQQNSEIPFSKKVKNFFYEGERLSKFSNPHIVPITDFFFENNTAYLVLEFIEGENLKQFIEKHGLLSVEDAFVILHQLLEAVEVIHNHQILHRDIKPENIIITPSKQAVLIDFGSSREYSDNKTLAQTAIVTPGYSPIEQYSSTSRKGTYSDIYALGATLYFLLTGVKPLNSTERTLNELSPPHLLNDRISTQVSSAIMLAMQMKPKDRFQTIKDFREALYILQKKDSLVEIEDIEQSKIISEPKPQNNPQKKLLPFYIIGFAIIVVLGIFMFYPRTIIESQMVEVAGGPFMMGCTYEQSNCDNDEKLVHHVTLNDFSIGKYEVTQAEWRSVMSDNPSKHIDCDSCPVENVTWIEVQDFITKLNDYTSKKYRLPTEAEWEYAARGGAKSLGLRYAGSNLPSDVSWFKGNSDKRTHEVGELNANELGIFDMSGNVIEWCNDWYDKDYYTNSQVNNPKGPLETKWRVCRGGRFSRGEAEGRNSNRGYSGVDTKSGNLGFRLVLDK